MKKKILVFTPTITTTNNFFLQSRSFEEMADIFDIYVCVNNGIKGSELDLFEKRGFKKIFAYQVSAKRKNTWDMQFHINTLGGRRLSRNCSIMYNMNKNSYGHILKRVIHKTLGFSYKSARLTSAIIEKYIGEDKNIKNIINSVKPDLIVAILCGSAPVEIESIKAGKLYKIPVLGIQNGWDNICTRGLMPFLPDYIGVWGYQSRIFAEKIHNIPSERIFHIGAPFTDIFKMPQSNSSRLQTMKTLGLPGNKKVFFFAGNIWAYNEVRTLKLLNDSIDKNILRDCCILYRPHPFQHRAKDDLNFFMQDFKHVYLDPTLAKQYKEAVENNKNFKFNKSSTPIDFKHMSRVFAISSLIIAPLSTVMIQGAICGLPSVGILYTDKANRRFVKRCDFEEMSIIKGMPGVFLCKEPSSLVETCVKALKFVENKINIDLLKNYAALVVHKDRFNFRERLQNAINAILNPQEDSIFHFLNKPLLAAREAKEA